jgi:hypothetical protein
LYNNSSINHVHKRTFIIEIISGTAFISIAKLNLDIVNNEIDDIDKYLKDLNMVESNANEYKNFISDTYRLDACKEIIKLKPWAICYSKNKITNDAQILLNMTNNERLHYARKLKSQKIFPNLLISLFIFIHGLHYFYKLI